MRGEQGIHQVRSDGPHAASSLRPYPIKGLRKSRIGTNGNVQR